jgi:hypothetical protein
MEVVDIFFFYPYIHDDDGDDDGDDDDDVDDDVVF